MNFGSVLKYPYKCGYPYLYLSRNIHTTIFCNEYSQTINIHKWISICLWISVFNYQCFYMDIWVSLDFYGYPCIDLLLNLDRKFSDYKWNLRQSFLFKPTFWVSDEKNWRVNRIWSKKFERTLKRENTIDNLIPWNARRATTMVGWNWSHFLYFFLTPGISKYFSFRNRRINVNVYLHYSKIYALNTEQFDWLSLN